MRILLETSTRPAPERLTLWATALGQVATAAQAYPEKQDKGHLKHSIQLQATSKKRSRTEEPS